MSDEHLRMHMTQAFYLGLFGAVGWIFWSYWISVHLLTPLMKEALPSERARLYGLGVVFLVGSAFLLALASGIWEAIPIALILAGWLGWLILGVKRLYLQRELSELRRNNALPRLQFSMMDIYLAVFFFALVMAVAATCTGVNSNDLAGLAVYLIVSSSIAFLVSMDLLRRGQQSPTMFARLKTTMGCLIFFSVSLVVGGLLAWLAWRKAILNVELEQWREKNAKMDQRVS